MRGAGVAAPNRLLTGVRQRATHAVLCQNVSRSLPALGGSPRRRLDAIIVPASRPASFLRRPIELSALLGVPLVVLCSEQTKVEHVVQRVEKMPGARSLVVEIAKTWSHPMFPGRTSLPAFQKASAYRGSDLSAKRNIGLLLARLHGWNKVVFLDDDIILQTDNLVSLAGQLDDHQVAGMVVPKHPDNSVVCHARRLAGLDQDVFVTGAVLGVHCNSLPLSFFPNIYNEDWFFFAREAAARRLSQVGRAKQNEYDPFAIPNRASEEEFGDLLAEGLYALMGEEDPSVPFDEQLRAATEAYWSAFIEARRQVLTETMALLLRSLDRNEGNDYVSSAAASLAAAETQLDTITPDLCMSFIDAWRDDLDDWQKFSSGVNNMGSTAEAMDFLELKTWTQCQFGAGVVKSQTVAWSGHLSSRRLMFNLKRRSYRPTARRT
jgi:hypothetical protein